jgi:hypothetical protein
VTNYQHYPTILRPKHVQTGFVRGKIRINYHTASCMAQHRRQLSPGDMLHRTAGHVVTTRNKLHRPAAERRHASQTAAVLYIARQSICPPSLTGSKSGPIPSWVSISCAISCSLLAATLSAVHVVRGKLWKAPSTPNTSRSRDRSAGLPS